MNRLYFFEAARTPEQLKKMEELESEGICVFCLEHFHKNHENPIVIQSDLWYVTYNDFPYKGTKLHLLIVPKRHVRSLSDLNEQEAIEFLAILKRIKSMFEYTSEAVVARSGDMRFNGGSVEHLHLHYVVGETDNPKHEPIKFKVSSRPKNAEPPNRT